VALLLLHCLNIGTSSNIRTKETSLVGIFNKTVRIPQELPDKIRNK
jgi:hypothetical protein